MALVGDSLDPLPWEISPACHDFWEAVLHGGKLGRNCFLKLPTGGSTCLWPQPALPSFGHCELILWHAYLDYQHGGGGREDTVESYNL